MLPCRSTWLASSSMSGTTSTLPRINEETLESFQLHLAGQVKAGEISQTYANNVCNATVKPFMRYLAKHRKDFVAE